MASCERSLQETIFEGKREQALRPEKWEDGASPSTGCAPGRERSDQAWCITQQLCKLGFGLPFGPMCMVKFFYKCVEVLLRDRESKIQRIVRVALTVARGRVREFGDG